MKIQRIKASDLIPDTTSINMDVLNMNRDKFITKVRSLQTYKGWTVKNIINELKTNEDIQNIWKEIFISEDTDKYKQFLTGELESNCNHLRNIRNYDTSLNEISKYDNYIESSDIQVYDSLHRFDTIFQKNIDLTFCINDHKNYITKYGKSYNNINLNFRKEYANLFDDKDPLSLVLTLRELYCITKDMDDIDIYDKYSGYNNIDISNLISDIFFKNSDNNILNILLTNNNMRGLIKKNITTNSILGCLFRNTVSKFTHIYPEYPLITNNSVTCFDNTYVTTETNDKVYPTRTLGELLLYIIDDEYGKTDKKSRKQIYMTYDGSRPKSSDYDKWNGLQIYDIDLKEWISKGGNISLFKNIIFNELSKFHWFLWICYSSSGNGLHIWTKSSPPINAYINNGNKTTTDIPEHKYLNNIISRYWYLINYYVKGTNIYDVIYSNKRVLSLKDNDFIEPQNNSKYITGFEFKYVDNTVGRITSGIRLSYDSNIMINPNFLDLPIAVDMFKTVMGNDIVHAKKIFQRNTVISNIFYDNINEIIAEYGEYINGANKLSKIDKTQLNIESLVLKGYDLNDYKPLPLDTIKYRMRYEVCNTLAYVFGKDGLRLAHEILRSKECKNEKEIDAFYASAIRNRKSPSKYGLDIITKCGVVKFVKTEFNEELMDKNKLFIKKQIEKSLIMSATKYQIELDADEYLGYKFDTIKSILKSNKVNMIYAPPAAGKTTLIKDLAKTKRVMLVLPFISVIKNKIETDRDVMDLFDCYYNDKDISKLEHGVNAVTTFDKFSKANYEKISRMFDYIVIDEEHLLFNSQYRIHTTSSAIRNIKKLLYISSNDPFSAKIILMTGTPTGSEFFFSKVSNIIRVHKKLYDKSIQFHICDDILDVTTRLSYKAANLINDGNCIIIPTNKGDIYSEKIIGMIKYLLNRDIKYGYYKRSNNDQDICKVINEYNTTSDYDIVFCSNYLSVGIDINDENKKFAVLYCGNWSAFEIEQFNSRIRKQNIISYYFIKTINNDGKIDQSLYESPEFQLRLTDDDILKFNDDKAVANKKDEFLACYDPILHNIVTPGFSVVGKNIVFDKEQYELINFENKYNECFQHPIKISDVLYNYGYNVTVSTEFDGLSEELQDELKKIGMESAKEERLEKNHDLLGTLVDLITVNDYVSKTTGLEFHNTIEYIMDHKYDIKDDRLLFENEKIYVKVIFNTFAQPEDIIVKSKVSLEKVIGYAKYLMSKYSRNKALDIINRYVDDKGVFIMKKFNRAINLLKIMESHSNNELSPQIEKLIEKIYEFVDMFEADSELTIKYTKYTDFIDALTNEYINYLGISIRTKYGWDKLRDTTSSLFSDIAIRESAGKGLVRFKYNKIPDQDNNNILNRRSIDELISRIFNITEEIITDSKHINPRKKHIELIDQPY